MNRHKSKGKIIIRYIWILILFICFSTANSISQISIQIKDTTINRGVISEVPIFGTLLENNLNELEIVFEYNALNIHINSISGGNDNAMKCPEPEYDIDLTDLRKALLTVQCQDIMEVENGIFCILHIEGLAGPDSINILQPAKLLINGEERNDVVFESGTIKVPGIPVIQSYPEGIGNNYPNPFYGETRFPLTIDEPTKVRFRIYTTDGKFVLSNEKQDDMLKLSFYKNDIEVPISNLNNKLEQGNYILELSPDNTQFASGGYYLIMITDNGVQHKNFIYLK
ncbi:hypothetical protein ACFLSQ_00165 [Bacteroidota bacterium]